MWRSRRCEAVAKSCPAPWAINVHISGDTPPRHSWRTGSPKTGQCAAPPPRGSTRKGVINCAGGKYTIEQMPNGEITVKQRVDGVNKTIAKGQIKATLRKIAEITANFQYDENWNTHQFGKKLITHINTIQL